MQSVRSAPILGQSKEFKAKAEYLIRLQDMHKACSDAPAKLLNNFRWQNDIGISKSI